MLHPQSSVLRGADRFVCLHHSNGHVLNLTSSQPRPSYFQGQRRLSTWVKTGDSWGCYVSYRVEKYVYQVLLTLQVVRSVGDIWPLIAGAQALIEGRRMVQEEVSVKRLYNKRGSPYYSSQDLHFSSASICLN